MTTTFQREDLKACVLEAQPLLRAHFEEIAHYQDIPLDPDWEGYYAIEAAGALRVYTVRDEGRLCGYAVFVVRRNLHYRSSLQAVQDILYLEPPMRKQMTGIRFIQWCDRQLSQESVQVVYHHVKVSHDFGPVLGKLGYEHVDAIWGKRLDRGRA